MSQTQYKKLIKDHLEKYVLFDGVDLRLYALLSTLVKKGCSNTEQSNIFQAKVNRVRCVLDDIDNKRSSSFNPLAFETQCCGIKVSFKFIPRYIYFCSKCHRSVGAHKDFMPFGELADRSIVKIRKQLHESLDVLWQEGDLSRNQAYELLSKKLNINRNLVHIGNVSDNDDCFNYFNAIQWLKNEYSPSLVSQ